jgi:hypothetical protein
MQATDKAPTDSVADNSPNSEAQAGLESNPAKGEIFSDKHPYFADSCAVCPVNGRRLNLFAFRQKKDCYACQNTNKLIDTAVKAEKSEASQKRAKYMSEMEPLLEKKIVKKTPDKNIAIKFTKYGNKHLYSDTFGRAKGLKKDDLKNIDAAFRKSTYAGESKVTKPRPKDNIEYFYYFKDKTKNLYYNVGKGAIIDKRGKKRWEHFLYSVTNRLQGTKK